MSKSGYVTIIGRPNAGKSTLLNRLIGSQVSIVTPKAQTTRSQISGILTERQGQIVFLDTPGIHRAKEGGLNACMMGEVKEALEAPDLIWYLVDPSSALVHENEVLEILNKSKRVPIFLIFNKADRHSLKSKNTFISELESTLISNGASLTSTHQVSALKGGGVDLLLEKTWELLPSAPAFFPDPDQVSDRPIRFFVSEKIREQLMLCLGEEVPYSCAVQIERFDENAKPLRIEASIAVERESQKAIVIGKSGQKIKEIGTRARANVEEFLGQKIFLGLKVKLIKDWTRDPDALEKLGYIHAGGRR